MTQLDWKLNTKQQASSPQVLLVSEVRRDWQRPLPWPHFHLRTCYASPEATAQEKDAT